MTKEHRSVQPSSLPSTSRGSISTMSRGSIKSDPFTEETSSISARSDTSADSLIFDPSFGKSWTTDTKLRFFVHVPNDNMIVSIGKSKNQQQYFAFNCCLLVKWPETDRFRWNSTIKNKTRRICQLWLLLSVHQYAIPMSRVMEVLFLTGAIRPDLYPRKDAVLQQSSVEQCQGKLHIRIKYDFRTSDVLVHLIEGSDSFLFC